MNYRKVRYIGTNPKMHGLIFSIEVGPLENLCRCGQPSCNWQGYRIAQFEYNRLGAIIGKQGDYPWGIHAKSIEILNEC